MERRSSLQEIPAPLTVAGEVPPYVTPRVLSVAKLVQGEYKVAVEKSAVSLWELRQRTSPFSKKYVPGCRPSVLRAEPRRARWLFRVRCSKPDSKPEGHIVRIRVLRGRGDQIISRDILVSCSCPAWAYWGADYNAFHNGYSEAVRAKIHLDRAIRDPGRTYLICKHVYAIGSLVRGWAVPKAFEVEQKKRREMLKAPPKKPTEAPKRKTPQRKQVDQEEIPEVEPGVPDSRSRRPEPQIPSQEPPLEAEEGLVSPQEEVAPEEEEDEDFPVYLL